MSSSIYELKFTFMDVMQLFGIEEKSQEKLLPDKRIVEGWRLEPNLIVCLDGIFIDTEYTAEVAVPSAERQSYMSHPEGDPRVPLVKFPCTLEDLRKFADFDCEGRIDPFDLAEMVADKIDFIVVDNKETEVRSAEKKSSIPPGASPPENEPLYTDHLLGIAIEVQHKYWESLQKPYPKQEGIINDLLSQHSLSKQQAHAIEIVACPVNRKK
ncbi:MAG: hypothetical protein ACQEXG_15945 [Pseudomonadota bacterium]